MITIIEGTERKRGHDHHSDSSESDDEGGLLDLNAYLNLSK